MIYKFISDNIFVYNRKFAKVETYLLNVRRLPL